MQLSPDPLPGYRVLHSLDPDQQGSVADSVLAEDPARGQPVVVKRLHPHLQHLPHFASALRSAGQWAQQWAPRPSSGLVRVLTLSAKESSLSIVTEYIEGCSLRALVSKQAPSRRLPWSCIFMLIDKIIDLLLKNQEHGLTFHGYLHPGNILLSNQFAADGQRAVLIDDWYIGRAVQTYCRQRVIDKRKTLAGMMLLGDLRFLSPEQCQELPDITSAADVYALGMLIYNLVSGQHPFESAEAHDLDLAIQQVQTVPGPLQAHEPNIPLALSQLVDETLRKVPAERPTLAALRERLRGCQQGLLASRPFQLETPLGYNGICQQHAGHEAGGTPCVIAQTQITRCQDRHERALDRLAASLYLLNQSNLSGYRRVLRYDRIAHDELFIIAEALPGGSLADMLAAQNDSQDPARISKIVSIMHQVARLLRDTHESNYVYLGLRPSSIWLVPGPDSVPPYRVVLLESETFRRGFSGERTISGSDRPEDLSPQSTRYVAPEQYYGAATPAADAFSLGAVLFEALNLRPPFATAELTDLRRRAEPEASLKPAQHDPSIDPELAALTNQLLSPLPRLRPTLAETEQRLLAIFERLRLAPPPLLPERAPPQSTPAVESQRGQGATPASRSTLPESAAPPRSTPGSLVRGSTEELRSDAGLGPDGRFSGYRITRSLGEGGNSAVFHVVETATGREFAIKEMKLSSLRNGAALQRFNNELRFSQLVPHPGVIRCHQIYHQADSAPWMRMEYIPGRTLRARLTEKRPVTPDEALQYARWISTVMVAVHAKRIVHRDLKPENIILTLDKADEYPIRIIDFGIAKQEQVNQTAVGTVMGTPCYMPPEQCRDAGMVDAKADVFALGAILYEMLCGWQAQNEQGVMSYISTKKYTPIPSLPASLPREISRYVMRMLAYEPALRPTMEEAERTLRNLHKLAIHGYGAWLVGSLASYTSERLRQSALPLITGTLMVSTFAFGGYLAFAANQKQDAKRVWAAIAESDQRHDWQLLMAQTRSELERNNLSDEQRAHVLALHKKAQSEIEAQAAAKSLMKISNYRDAAAQLKAIGADSFYRLEAEARVRLLRDERVAELVRETKEAAARRDCLTWQSKLPALRELSPADEAEQAKAGCVVAEKPAPPSAKPGPGASPAVDKPALSQEAKMLQRAEEALGRGNYDEALKQVVSGLLNTLEGTERARRLVVRGKAACVLSQRSLAETERRRGLVADYNVAIDQLQQMGSSYEKYFQELTRYCQKAAESRKTVAGRIAK